MNVQNALAAIKANIMRETQQVKYKQIPMTKFRKDARRLCNRIQEYPHYIIFLTAYGKPTGALIGPAYCPKDQIEVLVNEGITILAASYQFTAPNLRFVLRHKKSAGAILNQNATLEVFGKDFNFDQAEQIFSNMLYLGQMQTPEAKEGMRRAFNATPEELGEAAVKAARSQTRRDS